MKICIIPNESKDIGKQTTKEAEKLLDKLGIEYFEAPLNVDNKNFVYTDPTKFPEDTDIVMVFGGDGTIIDASIDLLDTNIPIVGVNLGRLGYLAEIEMTNMEKYLKLIKDKKYDVENRMMLEVEVNSNNKFHLLNDIVLRHTSTTNMIGIDLFVNDKYITTFNGDGLIVSTPTGSTAYNLSAGGPIIEPYASLITITPICSHNLGFGSIVLESTDQVMLKLSGDSCDSSKEAEIIVDGKHRGFINSKDTVEIKKSKSVTPLLKLADISFLEILRKKMKG